MRMLFELRMRTYCVYTVEGHQNRSFLEIENTNTLGLVCDLKIRVAPHSRTDRKESVALCDKVAQKCYRLKTPRKVKLSWRESQFDA